jgi:hypothetical protein
MDLNNVFYPQPKVQCVMKMRLGIPIALALCASTSSAYAISLAELIGPNLVSFSAQFDRYDFDNESGKMSGPSVGYIELQRPGSFSIKTQEGSLVVRDGQAYYSPCDQCASLDYSAEKLLGKELLNLVQTGDGADAFFNAPNTQVHANKTVETTYSLNSFGYDSGNLKLWSDGYFPTSIEINLNPKHKIILQLHDVKLANRSTEK